ncbi:MAG: SGNH/GDSL hydrolase family protein [Nitrospirota bacterium]|nr:SGNH/GDSL hydrolase family protein [Nitrospirota bacterium]
MQPAIDRPSIRREWAIRLLLISVSCVVAVVFAEATVRVFFPISDGLENVTLDGKPIKGFFDPGSVYRQVANEYDALTTITDKGHRVPGVEGNPDTVFIGDSFTYGFGLNDEETFALIYCKQQRRECVNLGIPGSGTLRQVEKLEAFIEKWHWKPKEVKLFFFGMSGSFSAGNDFVDNYDRYIREHSSQAEVEQRVRDGTPRGGEPLGLTERLINLQGAILEHSTLMRLAKYHWGPMLKSLFVVDPGNERMALALAATRESLSKLDELSRRIGFDYSIYLLVPVQDIIRGTYGETLATLNGVAPKPVIATAQLFLDSPKDYYFAFDGHFNAKGSKRIAEFLILNDH